MKVRFTRNVLFLISLLVAAFPASPAWSQASGASPSGSPKPVEKIGATSTNPGGSTTTTTTYSDGITTTERMSPDGHTTTTLTHPDGYTVTSVMSPDSSRSTTKTYPKGTTSTTRTEPNGDRYTITRHRDGSTTRTTTYSYTDGFGYTTTTYPDGSTTTTYRDGSTARTRTDPDGSTTTTNPDGSTTTTLTEEGVPKPTTVSGETPMVEETKQPSWWESLIPALIPSIGIGGGKERDRRQPSNPCSGKK